MKIFKAILSVAIATALVLILNNPIGGLPAMGKLFSPFEGFWQNGESKLPTLSSDLKIEGLKGKVSIKYDDNHVPHIFAENDDDLYFAQGYITAQDRLWQMEFYPRVAAGRVSEIFGEKALAFDKYNRHLGMAHTAEKIVENLKKDPLANSIMQAYSNGVNAYIKQLKPKDYPVEYKVIGNAPETWSPLKSILLMMAMRNTLNGGTSDLVMANVMQKYGPETVKDLFPDYPVDESPIIPTGTKHNFTPVKQPVAPSAGVQAPTLAGLDFGMQEANHALGSNNWAVGGSKSATGLPILSNDPHLQLTLPSIWYQAQLVSPNVNAYGASLPGAPGIIIGFNKDIAWGVTNTGSDVMDFYQIQFKDKSWKEYKYDGQWKATTQKIEKYAVKGMKEAVTDTVFYTHHGPILTNQGVKPFRAADLPGLAMRWICNETTGYDLMTFYYLNRAKNYDDYRKALTFYTAPAQNFIFASNNNDIAITPNGKFPLKWKEQGKFLMDGSNPVNDWQGFIPTEHNPTVKNPGRGFVSSANQSPTDPTYPYYMGWQYASTERATRINERLTKMEKATVDSLRSILNDNFSVQARRVLPTLLGILAKDSSMKNDGMLKKLAAWNFDNSASSVEATVFETWVGVLMEGVWDEFKSDDKTLLKLPSRERTWSMIKQQPTAKWFDNANTKDKTETMEDIVKVSFKGTLDTLTHRHGPMNPVTWAWSAVKNTTINHLVPAFKGFARKGIMNGGGSTCVNATTASTGPSWRMIVELNKDYPKAYGLFPGGQSGNPGSKFYDNMIDKWTKGELNELLYLKSVDEKSDKISSTILMQK
jgi:penicillin G amidase